jgi:hypothetical protein
MGATKVDIVKDDDRRGNRLNQPYCLLLDTVVGSCHYNCLSSLRLVESIFLNKISGSLLTSEASDFIPKCTIRTEFSVAVFRYQSTFWVLLLPPDDSFACGVTINIFRYLVVEVMRVIHVLVSMLAKLQHPDEGIQPYKKNQAKYKDQSRRRHQSTHDA